MKGTNRMFLETILLGVSGNTIYEFIKLSVKHIFGQNNNEVTDKIYNAFETAVQRFYERYGNEFGNLSDSFLAREENWQIILKSMFYSNSRIITDDLIPEGFQEAKPATIESMNYFIEELYKEMKKDFFLDKIIKEKEFMVNTTEKINKVLKKIDSISKKKLISKETSKPKLPGQLPFNNLPFKKNPNFTGRKEILEKIRESFELGQYISLTQSVTGLGGVGKTQIALEYAFRYGYLYETIWWVNAESSQTIMESYTSFVYKNKHIDKNLIEKEIILEAVWNWMSRNNNWLFIYDNAEDEKSIYKFLPRINTGHILITSRYANWHRLGKVLSIDVFKQDEAETFLINSIGIEDRKSARELAEELGYLPLALEQAVAYVKGNKITYEKYIELFKKYKLEIFEEDGYEPNDYNSTITLTWNISIEKIRNKSANQLLYICSFLAPDNIDIGIFGEGKQYLPEPLASEVSSELKYNKIISKLAQYSLIKIQGNKISVHRLLQEVIRKSINKKEWLGYCLNIMTELFNDDNNYLNTWDKYVNIIPHALSVAKHSDKLCIDLEKVAQLYFVVAEGLCSSATYKEAEALYKRILEIIEELNGTEDPEIAIILNELAHLYNKQGRYKEAEPLFKRALEIMEEKLEMKHPYRVNLLSNIGRFYNDQGRYEEAEPLFKRALEIEDKIKGDVKWGKYERMAVTFNDYGLLCQALGRYEEAEALFKKSLDISEEVHGAKHPDNIGSLNNLANLYINQEKYDKAKLLLKKAFKLCQKMLGTKHPDMACVLSNLAVVYNFQGKVIRSKLLFKRAIKIKEEVQGAEHPNNAIILHQLGHIYSEQRRYEEAETLYKRALEIREKIVVEHPDTATILSDLAQLYHTLGRYKEAETLYKRTLEIREKTIGAKHPDTANILSDLARFYHTLGRYKEAEPLYKRKLEIQEEKLGANHPDTAITLNDLGRLYFNWRKYEKAELFLKRILKKGLRATKHLDTAAFLRNLGEFYVRQKRYEEAEPLYKRAIEIIEEVQEVKHPDMAITLNGLARLYYNWGKYNKVEPLHKNALEIQEEVLGTKHPDTATTFKCLARLYAYQGKFTIANELAKRAIEIMEEVQGMRHIDTANILIDLAEVFVFQHKYGRAWRYFTRALEIQEEVLGSKHLLISDNLIRLAHIYIIWGRYKEAESLFKRALEIREEVLGAKHLDTVNILNYLVLLYDSQGKYKEVIQLLCNVKMDGKDNYKL